MHTLASSRARSRASVGACAVALAAMMHFAPPADATTTIGVTGTPGSTFHMQAAGYSIDSRPIVRFGTVDAHRSSAHAGTQTIWVTYDLLIWDGNERRWKLHRQVVDSRSVPAGYRASFAARAIYTEQWSALFAVKITVTWGTAGGAFVAQKVEAFQSSADYTCWSPAPRCSVYTQAGGGPGLFFASVG